MNQLNNINTGIFAEQLLAAELIKRNLKVSKPIGVYSYDLLVDNDSKIFKVQVKLTEAFTKRKDTRKVYRISICKGNKTKVRYSQEEVDIFACFIADLGVWYFIPNSEDLPKNLALYTHIENSKEKYFENRDFYSIFI
jgi:hypothetical protein